LDLYPRDIFLGCMAYKMTKPSPSYRLNEKKGKRAPKRSVRIAFTVVLKTLDTSACHELVYAATGENLGVSQKPHGHANYLIFTEINIGAVLPIDQNMGTRVLGMRDLKIHCFCLRVRVDKYVGHTVIKRATVISQMG